MSLINWKIYDSLFHHWMWWLSSTKKQFNRVAHSRNVLVTDIDSLKIGPHPSSYESGSWFTSRKEEFKINIPHLLFIFIAILISLNLPFSVYANEDLCSQATRAEPILNHFGENVDIVKSENSCQIVTGLTENLFDCSEIYHLDGHYICKSLSSFDIIYNHDGSLSEPQAILINADSHSMKLTPRMALAYGSLIRTFFRDKKKFKYLGVDWRVKEVRDKKYQLEKINTGDKYVCYLIILTRNHILCDDIRIL